MASAKHCKVHRAQHDALRAQGNDEQRQAAHHAREAVEVEARRHGLQEQRAGPQQHPVELAAAHQLRKKVQPAREQFRQAKGEQRHAIHEKDAASRPFADCAEAVEHEQRVQRVGGHEQRGREQRHRPERILQLRKKMQPDIAEIQPHAIHC